MEIDSVIIRKSPIILLYKMIITTLIVYVLFTLYSVFLHQEGTNSTFIDLFVGKAALLIAGVGVEALAIIVLFLKWSYATYEIKTTELITRTGIFWRRQEVHSLKNMQAVYTNQGFFGTLFGYGTLRLHNPLSKAEASLVHIQDPEKYGQALRNVLEQGSEERDKIVPSNNA